MSCLAAGDHPGGDVLHGGDHRHLRLGGAQHAPQDVDGVEVVLLAVLLQQVLHQGQHP
jgi:hypothetical protein